MEISKKQSDKIKEIAEKYRLRLVLLFGSRVDEKMIHPESDYDIAYLPEKSFDFQGECYLNYEFTNVMPSDSVDTVDMKKAPPLLLRMIFENPQVLYEADELIFPTYQTYAIRRYFDEGVPVLEAEKRELKKKIAAY